MMAIQIKFLHERNIVVYDMYKIFLKTSVFMYYI